MAEILHQLIGSLSHYLKGFIHPRWCKISAINSMEMVHRNQHQNGNGYLHLVDFSLYIFFNGFHVGKYTSPMDPMGESEGGQGLGGMRGDV